MRSSKKSRIIDHVIVLAMVLCMLLSMVIPVGAETINKNVTDAKNGVVQIQVWFYDPETAVEFFLHMGTGFLINQNTVVTCDHVATGFPDSFYVDWAKSTNKALGGKRTAAQIKEHLELRISIYRDVYIKATVKKASSDMDYAILTLNEDVSDRTPLVIRDSSKLQQTEAVYALGFPGDLSAIETVQTFDSDDVTITTGNVNKVGTMSFVTREGRYYDNVDCVESSALISGGNSGGPLVDENGCVVGINAVGNDTRNIAISSEQLIKVLKPLGIKFTESGEPPVPDPDKTEVDYSALQASIAKAESKVKEDYSADSYQKLSDAIVSAKAALSAKTQSEVDLAKNNLDSAINNLVQAPKTNWALIIIIAVVVLAIIGVAVVVIVLLSGNKKKNNQEEVAAPDSVPAFDPKPTHQKTAVGVVTGTTVAQAASDETTVLSAGGSETTVLSGDGSETTVLSKQVDGGKLVRSSNNENIPITYSGFTIGKKRREVDYCIGDNTNISRNHAKFIVRDGVTYITDNKSTNGTFVNNTTVRPGDEVALKDGDTIMLADEKFEYKK